MAELSMSQCLGRRLSSQKRGLWLYRFACHEPGCRQEIRIPRNKIEGHTGFCGVHQAMKAKERRKDSKARTLYRTFCNAAVVYNKPNTITFEQFLVLMETPTCTYCGEHIPWLRSTGYFLDRIDNTLGYSVENVVVACALCNFTRGSRFTVEEMMEIGAVIRKIRAKRVSEDFQTQNDTPQLTSNQEARRSWGGSIGSFI